ncbi:major facilitator superfamily domain-containing protein [Dipodascopsis uninucleata]
MSDYIKQPDIIAVYDVTHEHSRRQSSDSELALLERPWYRFFDEYEYQDLYDRNGLSHKWYHWFDENDTPEERRYLIKLDLLLTFYCFVSYWVKNLDQSNISNAYASGMKEDLNLIGNSLTHLTVIYSVGVVVAHFPMIYLFPKLRMDWLLPALDIIWGLFTLAQYRAKSKAELMVFRFFVGLCEGPFFPGVHYVLGAWFKSHEIQRRGGIFYMGLALGSMTSGLLQGAVYNSLNGVGGLAGWRWMFIFDAVITIPIGILGFLVWPGTPDKMHSIFFTEKDRQIALVRQKKYGYRGPKGFSWPVFKKALTSWHLPVLAFWDVLFFNSAGQAGSGFILWLKASGKYSTSKMNDLSSIPPALLFVWLIIICFGADIFRSRWFFLCFSQFINWIGCVILAIWFVPDAAKWFAFMTQYFSWAMSSVLYGWMNSTLKFDDEYRSIVLLTVDLIANQSTIWTPLIFWKTSEAPRYRHGYIFVSCTSGLIIPWTIVVLYFYKKQEKQYYFKRLNELNAINFRLAKMTRKIKLSFSE